MAETPPRDLYAFQVQTIDGHTLPLASLQGRVVLIVNTASACGFTPQLGGLQALHERYAPEGLTVLGFPCNQFGSQDPGTLDQIASFCQTHYGVTFPMMAKVEVNGPDAAPLFQWLTGQAPGWLGTRAIKWNFTKFLVGRQGQVLNRYARQTAPPRLVADIEAALAQQA